ncbi:MAG TPA: SNF2-related protein [Methylomirabilota bacterium]|nr:SNF2-related protein [Methylomirabilota bacterium]
MNVELTEPFLAKIAGWEAMKAARALIASGKVLSSNYTPPILKGVVQDGTISYRAGLVLKSGIDLENICTCRASRDWGTICAHSVAVGLHHLQPPGGESGPVAKRAGESTRGSPSPTFSPARPPGQPMRLRRAATGEPGAELLELHVILPPSFADAASRGKVMLVLEGKWSRGRVPLNALPREQPFQLSESDEKLLSRIEEFAGEPAGMVVITTHEFIEMLPALADHPRITLGKATPLRVTREPWWPALRATLEANGEITLATREPMRGPVLIETSWVFTDHTLQPLGLAPGFLSVLQKPVRITRREVPAFLNNEFQKLTERGIPIPRAEGDAASRGIEIPRSLEANFSLNDFAVAPQTPQFILNLTGGLAQLTAQLQCKYPGRILTLGATNKDDSPWMPDPNDVKRYAMRDFSAEQQALARLLRVGFSNSDDQGRYQLNGQDRVLSFFAREYPRMQKEWEVSLEERLSRSTREKMERIEPRFEITPSGVQWFDFGVSFASSSGEQFSAADVQRLILSGQSHTRLKNGKVAVIDTGAVEELQQFLLDASPEQRGGKYRLSNVQSGFLESTLDQQGWQAQAPQVWRERARQQSGEAKLECPPLGELENVLRPYQKQGVAWLRFLRGNGFGGILADEMGLGKTLQTLAFLRAQGRAECPHAAAVVTVRKRRAEDSAPYLPSLVICPTSLVFNWLAEAEKFTPELRAVALHGPNRHKLFEQIPQSDLAITSYALVRRDWERYAALEFDTVVLDEAQHIKNRATQNAQAVKALRSQHRLVLTGTPLENSVLDLWSIFDFLMPGYLGSAKDFKERYEAPITREKNAEAQARLARRLKPFILRRLKRDVAKDLPAKIEQVTFCDLNDEQRALYQQVMEFSRKEVLEAVGAQGLAKSKLVIFTALLRLRQICCDLRLLNLEGRVPRVPISSPSPLNGERAGVRGENKNALNSPDENIAGSTTPHPQSLSPLRGEGGLDSGSRENFQDSGKVEAFDELLQEIIDGGHRVLVFSQFVTMLKLIEERLREQEVDFCYLDGSTTNRGEVVAKFQNGTAPVFLISLKAGGVGLNLTGADTVVHFDPWWNPAVEDQATDRAHRIGQSRVVTSYKLITRGTVEEKILTLQQKKREIIKATLGEEQFTEALNWDEIQELFS